MTNLQLTTPIALMAAIAAVGMTAMAFASVAVENYIQGFENDEDFWEVFHGSASSYTHHWPDLFG